MSLMPALPESIFDILYLIFALVSGVVLLLKAKGRPLITVFGSMTLLLGLGDSFHLIPRVLNYWTDADYTAALGIGKLVTSVTMTVFYLLFVYARRQRYAIKGQKPALIAVWALTVIRIGLCCFPQNGWTDAQPSMLWAILRNIPFAALGLLTVLLWLISAKGDKPLRFAWLAVTLSFLFYLPVVLWAQQIPLIGMLMLPKTCMYIWLILMFYKVEKES